MKAILPIIFFIISFLSVFPLLNNEGAVDWFGTSIYQYLLNIGWSVLFIIYLITVFIINNIKAKSTFNQFLNNTKLSITIIFIVVISGNIKYSYDFNKWRNQDKEENEPSSKQVEKNPLIFNNTGNQIITEEWINKNKSWISKSIRINVQTTIISDTSSEVIAKIYDIDPTLELMNSPLKLNRDTLLVDTLRKRIIDHHAFYYSKNDTVFIKFKTLTDTLKPFNKVGLLYRKEDLFFYIDTTFVYSRNINK